MNVDVGSVQYVLCQLEVLGLVCQYFFLCVDCYEYCLQVVLDLIWQQIVLLVLLLLCGLQILGELVLCSECLYWFVDIDEVCYVVECLQQCVLLVVLLCVSGQCEDCYMYLLCGEVDGVVLVVKYVSSGGGSGDVVDLGLVECVVQLEVVVVELQV